MAGLPALAERGKCVRLLDGHHNLAPQDSAKIRRHPPEMGPFNIHAHTKIFVPVVATGCTFLQWGVGGAKYRGMTSSMLVGVRRGHYRDCAGRGAKRKCM